MENIKNLLTVPFSKSNYKKFIINFLKEAETLPILEKIPPTTFRKTIESYIVFGTYKDVDENEIIILSIKVKNNSSAQTAHRQFVAYLLENEFINYKAAIVAYYDDIRENWKLSFVTIEYSLSDKGVELKFKPAKRFSFLVGKDEPTKTYVQQLNPIYDSNDKPTLNQITDAFSVSRLSRDFYEQYKIKYFELYDYLITNTNFIKEAKRLGYIEIEKFATTFCKKTLGQIMFIHFVQKKGWMGVENCWGDGDKQYLLNTTKSYNGNNYFNDVLEPLFYNALNVKRTNDLYLGEKVPFLNGGLFHPIEDYDWKNIDFCIPNDYWYNEEDNGLLNILSHYNFTVDESNPEEQEVAIDPEMLGKIFESLLDTKDRSSLGAFYTPREIVHFMCEESLAVRLAKDTGFDYHSIANYIRYGDALKETEYIQTLAKEIDECISNYTIVDPAVGSGAFLVGMLNQIVKLRMNLSDYTGEKVDKYRLKTDIIQNSLYGVDIEYDAVEIAKLRLWLSLIVDQEVDGTAPKPLPNLNFHLRVGNSLVDTFNGITLWNPRWKSSKRKVKVENQMNLFNVDTVDAIMKRLKNAKVKFFDTSDDKEKQKLANQIERDQMELIRAELVAKNEFALFEKIEEMIKKKTKPFFIWELEFEEVFEKGGFDIVIANPPYVQLQKDGGKLANELEDQGYETFTRMGDIYCIFYEKAFDLMKEKGILCYITSNKWMRAGYGKKLRGYLAKNSNPIKLIDFGGNKIFETATVDVNILIASNEKNKGVTVATTIGDDCSNNLSDYIKQYATTASFTDDDIWIILSNKIEISIVEKIKSIGTKLEDWDIVINYGIKTGYNEAFIIDESTKDDLILSDPKSAEIIRPILRGKDIKRYEYSYQGLYLICTFPSKHYDIEMYPAIKNHLLKFGKRRLSQSGEKNIDGIKGKNARKKTSNKWYETQDQISYWDDFNKRKIIYPCIMTTEPRFMFDQNGYYYTIAPGNIISGNHLMYLLAFLNSKICYFVLRKFFMGGGIEGELKTNRLLSLPIPLPDSNLESLIVTNIELLLEEYDKNGLINESLLEKIDFLVAKAYKLSETEIKYIINYEY
ncbi:MAG: Eco57I restriction-modification methylase domain-containing protein [Bacillota bacterium]|nr:Eco57I restriction-modification methylase domain-containing protein [Bacillota bacterium]